MGGFGRPLCFLSKCVRLALLSKVRLAPDFRPEGPNNSAEGLPRIYPGLAKKVLSPGGGSRGGDARLNNREPIPAVSDGLFWRCNSLKTHRHLAVPMAFDRG